MNFFSGPSSCRPQEQRPSSFRPSRRCQGFTVSTRCSRSVRRQLQQVREDACRFAARRLLGFTDLDKLVDIDNFRVVPSQLQSTLATLTECRRFWFPSRRALWLSLCLSAGFRPAAEAQPPIGSVFARGVHGSKYACQR